MPTLVITGEEDILVSGGFCKAEVLHAANDGRGGLCLKGSVVDLELGKANDWIAKKTYRELFRTLGGMVEIERDVPVLKQQSRRDWLPPEGLPVAVHIRRMVVEAGPIPLRWQTMLAVVLAEGVRNIANISYPEPGASWGTATNKSTTFSDALVEPNITVHMLDTCSKPGLGEPELATRVAYRALHIGGRLPDIRGGEGLYIGLHPQPAGSERPEAFGHVVERLISPLCLDEPITPRQ